MPGVKFSSPNPCLITATLPFQLTLQIYGFISSVITVLSVDLMPGDEGKYPDTHSL